MAGNTVASACSILDDMVQGISDQTGTSPSTWRKRTTDSNMQESNACSQGPCVSDGAKEMARGAPWTEDHEEGDDCWVKGLDLARAASLVESLPPCILSAVGPRHRSTVDSVTRSPRTALENQHWIVAAHARLGSPNQQAPSLPNASQGRQRSMWEGCRVRCTMFTNV